MDAIDRAMRSALIDSGCWTLGQLIDALSAAPCRDSDGDARRVEFDFCRLSPSGLHSYRGVYAFLAIGHSDPGLTSLEDFVSELNNAVGVSFGGWKGGEYAMSRETPMFVANNGATSDTFVSGVHVPESSYVPVVIRTKWDDCI